MTTSVEIHIKGRINIPSYPIMRRIIAALSIKRKRIYNYFFIAFSYMGSPIYYFSNCYLPLSLKEITRFPIIILSYNKPPLLCRQFIIGQVYLWNLRTVLQD